MLKKYSKIVTLLLALLIIVSSLAMADDSIVVEEKTVIEVLNMRFGGISVINDKMKETGDKIENLEVKTKSVGWGDLSKQSKVILSAGGESPYEILQAYNGWLPGYAYNDWLMPLTDYYKKYKEEYNLDDIPQELWDVVSINGEIYGFPFQQNFQHLFYRKDLFQKYDLQAPATYDELFKVLEVLKDKGDTQYQFALKLGGNSGCGTEFNNALRAYDGKWFTEDDRPAFNSEEGLKALKVLKKLMKYMPREVLSYSNNDVSVALQQGIIASANLWTSRVAEVNDEEVSVYAGKFGYAVPPSAVEGGTPHGNWTQDMFVIPKNVAIDPELIFQIIAKSLNEENMMDVAPHAIVASNTIAKDPGIVEKYPNYEIVYKAIENGAKSYPTKAYFGSARTIVGGYVSDYLAGNISAEEALAKAEKEVIKDMKEKGYIE